MKDGDDDCEWIRMRMTRRNYCWGKDSDAEKKLLVNESDEDNDDKSQWIENEMSDKLVGKNMRTKYRE